jgi:hypothetical protein
MPSVLNGCAVHLSTKPISSGGLSPARAMVIFVNLSSQGSLHVTYAEHLSGKKMQKLSYSIDFTPFLIFPIFFQKRFFLKICEKIICIFFAKCNNIFETKKIGKLKKIKLLRSHLLIRIIRCE